MLSSLARSRQLSHPPPILRCPYDVLCIIFAYADRSTLRSLHVTCRAIAEAVAPLVYRHITLTDDGIPEDPETPSFIIPDCGRFVQSCRIKIIRSWDRSQLPLVFFITMLWKMPNLKSLVVRSYPPLMVQLSELLSHLTDISDSMLRLTDILDPSPPWHLESFSSNTVFAPERFLVKHHTSLKHISLPYVPLSTPLLADDSRFLPALTSLRGQFRFITPTIRSRPVTRVYLEDPLNPINVRQLTDTLSLSSVPVTQVFVSIHQPSEAFETIFALAEGAPYIESLNIIIFNKDDHSNMRALLLAFRSFTNLRSIILVSSDFSRFGDLIISDISAWAPETLETMVLWLHEGYWIQFSSVLNVQDTESSSGNAGSRNNEAREIKSWVQVGEANQVFDEYYSELMYQHKEGMPRMVSH